MRKLYALLVTAALAAPLAHAADDIETLPSGVTVHYRGTLENGTEFDSSYKRGEPATFPLSRVIPCWTQGVQKLHVGEKARLVCPANTAYGEAGMRGIIPPNSTLRFEVELIAIE
jgi:FKBP-type peptidyl-prolyl cis-trans isomerase FkpA